MRLRRHVEESSFPLGDARFPQLPVGLTPQVYQETCGGAAPPVPPEQAPAADMPRLTVMVLDALADDAETFFTMRDCGDGGPRGLALVGERYLFDAVRTAMRDGLIEVEEEVTVIEAHLVHRAPPGPPPTSDEDLKRYWFVMTPTGWAAWGEAGEQLEAYWDAHLPASDGSV